MPEFITAYSKNLSYSAQIHTCYKWLHRLPSNICCGAKQSCLQMIITALLKQLEGISDSTARCMHFITLRMTTIFKALKSPSRMTVLQYRKSTSWIHQIQSNLVFTYEIPLLKSWDIRCMHDGRKQTFALFEAEALCYFFFLICPTNHSPEHPSVQHSGERRQYLQDFSSHLKCKGNSWGELILPK